ncbi:lipid A export permease/ATP-binding protein MsbA [Piscinibacter sakaiensis]|uniref:Lipid A export ATP-binding/permease protein MsbA n=1 Tax=Piscinibacter sakaiensis TaxID=1547922 RepID=A0A0K8P2A5_PISS1|nr:lipid A export permease/ATP-binding protein MsbA [Piscinibacter sakaiensis]GAP36659.1 lipid A export ATP-binding/permease protein MsbA [Piscinibacter sakaiensis]
MTTADDVPLAAAAPARPLRERLRRLWPYFAGSRLGVLMVLGGALVGAVTEPMIPALMKPLLDSGFNDNSLPLWLVPVVIIGLFAVRSAAGFVAQYGLSWTANHGMLNLRRAMFDRLFEASPTLFSQASASSLTNTVVYEVQNGTYSLVNSLLTLVRDSLMLVAMLAYLLWLNWQLTLFVAVLIPAVAFVMRHLSRRIHRLAVQGQGAVDDLAYVVEENVLAWRIVRLHDARAAQSRRFAAVSQALRRLSIKGAVAGASTTPITQMLASVALSAVIVAALWQAQQGSASVGSFVAFVTGMLMLIGPMKHLSEVAGPITRGLAALERAITLIEDSPPEVGGRYDPGRAAGRLELRGVGLRYASASAPALDGVDLVVPAGQTVALVGPSGAGKSTLVNLLPRFIEPDHGTLLLDGHPLRDWDVGALRRQFALVSQDVVLFNDSVAANVALGDWVDEAAAGTPGLPQAAPAARAAVRERVLRALQGANLMEHVASLPAGIDSVIGHNGSQLSGGQRQRLAIARAIYKDAPVLILDEATSALDSASERLVQQALETLMQGRTSLVIAHRLSTIERADRIVAMQDGRIVEQGSHAELRAAGGLYARLHALQFGRNDTSPETP